MEITPVVGNPGQFILHVGARYKGSAWLVELDAEIRSLSDTFRVDIAFGRTTLTVYVDDDWIKELFGQEKQKVVMGLDNETQVLAPRFLLHTDGRNSVRYIECFGTRAEADEVARRRQCNSVC